MAGYAQPVSKTATTEHTDVPAHNHGAHAVAHHDHAEKAPAVFNGVSEADVPSARWGWSMLKRGPIIASGLIGGLFLLGFLFGNHHGHVENIWLIALAALTFIGTLLYAFQPKLTQRQTVSARNKPQGHIEPNWAADQRNMTGAYADLTPEQLLALNKGTSEPERH